MSGKVRDYDRLAGEIIDIVGKDNITSCSRCATRLRLVLKETPAGAHDKVAALPGVITVAENGGQFQVVIGTHVGEVYDAAMQQLNLSADAAADAPKGSLMNRIIATMSAVFAPFVYILAAAGLLQGILIVINLFWPAFASTGTYEVLSFMSWTPFTFLPVFIGLTAARHFKTNEFIALLCCLAICNPTWGEIAGRIASGESIQFLFFNLSQTTYTSTVLPPLFLVLVLSWLEKWLNKVVNETVRPLLVPLLCLVIMVPLTLLVIGPLSDLIATGIAAGYNYLVGFAPVVAGALIGGLWQVVVIFGVHWGITPVVLANFANQGFDSFQVFQTCAVVAQVGACIGVAIKAKNKGLRKMAITSALPGFVGITEPIIYGVTLPRKKPFIMGCIAGAVGGILVALFGSLQYVYAGLPSMLTVVNAIDPSGKNGFSFAGMAIAALVSFILAIVLVVMFGFDETKENNTEVEEAEAEAMLPEADGSNAAKQTELLFPATGEVVQLADVPDPVFSSGAMGAGFAVDPADGVIYAPVTGTVVTIFDTLHAIGIKADTGEEVLVHVGIDTVNMGGKGFKAKVTTGVHVAAGDPLLEVDLEEIKKAGYSAITPVLVTNSAEFTDVVLNETKTAEAGAVAGFVLH